MMTTETPETPETTMYLCDDGDQEIEITATTPEAAAQEYVDGGDYAIDGSSSTTWVSVHVHVLGDDWDDGEDITVAVDPEEPLCEPSSSGSHNGEHNWQAPYELLGGLPENPGVQGHGGGVVATEICVRCGCARVSDSWAQDPETGQQGLDSVEYDPDDPRLEEYLAEVDLGDLYQENVDEDGVILASDDDVTGLWVVIYDADSREWHLTRASAAAARQ